MVNMSVYKKVRHTKQNRKLTCIANGRKLMTDVNKTIVENRWLNWQLSFFPDSCPGVHMLNTNYTWNDLKPAAPKLSMVAITVTVTAINFRPSLSMVATTMPIVRAIIKGTTTFTHTNWIIRWNHFRLMTLLPNNFFSVFIIVVRLFKYYI